MNCKQGDLAVIVRGSAFQKYIGHVVQCVTLRCTDPAMWAIDRSLDGDQIAWIMVPDSCLRPLRDSDGEDEMLRIKGKPQRIRKNEPVT